MSIKEELAAELRDAMRQRDTRRLNVIRQVETEVSVARAAPGFRGEVDDALYQQVIADMSAYLGKRLYFRIPLTRRLIDLLIALFRIQMAAWDRFCLDYRHFTHRHFVNPSTYGLPMRCATVADLLAASGVPSPRTPQVAIAPAPLVKAESGSPE